MVNMYGAGKAFDLRFSQRMFVPGRSLMNPRSSFGTIFGGRPVVQNITVQTTPGGFWGGLMGLGSGFMMGSMIMSGLRGLLGGLFGGGGFGMGGFGMGGLGMGGGCFGTGMPYPAMGGLTGTMPQTITGAGQTQPQTTAQKLANLKTLYPGYNIVAEDDGTFSATKTDKDGNIAEIGTKLSYEDMLDALKANNKTEPQGVTDDSLKADGEGNPKADGEGNPKADGEGNPKVDGEGNPEVTGGGNPKASREEAHNPGATDGPGKTYSSRNPNKTGKSSGSGNTGKANGSGNAGKANKKEWSAAEKAKPIRLQMSVSVAGYTHTGSAKVVTPDGKLYFVNTTQSKNGSEYNLNTALNDFAKKLKELLKDAGWTNVTLENKECNWSSDGSKAVGDVHKTRDWTDEQKAAYKGEAKITFYIRNRGSDGSASVVTPDGKLHQVSISQRYWNMATGAKSAMKDLLQKMQKEELKKWPQIKLVPDTKVGEAAFED